VYHEIRDKRLRPPESLYRLEQVGSWSDKGGVESHRIWCAPRKHSREGLKAEARIIQSHGSIAELEQGCATPWRCGSLSSNEGLQPS
jgi:hypothetical protein